MNINLKDLTIEYLADASKEKLKEIKFEIFTSMKYSVKKQAPSNPYNLKITVNACKLYVDFIMKNEELTNDEKKSFNYWLNMANFYCDKVKDIDEDFNELIQKVIKKPVSEEASIDLYLILVDYLNDFCKGKITIEEYKEKLKRIN